MDERTVTLPGVALRVAEAGSGQRPLLLVHGFTGAKEDFTPWLDELAELGYWAVAPDLRGHGGSGKPAGHEHYSLELLAADLVALADELGWDRFSLLGHSMGGMVAQTLVLAAPARVDALVLMDTSHGPVGGIDRGLLDLALAVIAEGGMDGLVDAMTEIGSPLDTPASRALKEVDPAHEERGWAQLRATSPDLYGAMAPALLEQEDRLERLERLAVPTLVVVGDQDQPFLADSERMAATIPGAELVVIPDAGHSPQFEHPAPWWEAVSGFLLAAASPAGPAAVERSATGVPQS